MDAIIAIYAIKNKLENNSKKNVESIENKF